MKSNDKKQVALIILDGWGYREATEHNAIAQANTPNFDRLWKQYPHALLKASGEAVGLPDGQMGNSEVGHTTIGAGKTLDTDLVRISKAIENGEFDTNPAFVKLFDHVKKNNSVLHVQGLLSDGGVHSHMDHLTAFLKSAKKAGVEKVAIHVFTDGRDTAPQSAGIYLKQLEDVIAEVGIGYIATLSGRFYAMDRDNNWDRLKKVEDALFECKGNVCELKSPSVYMNELYGEGVLDEHVEPIVFSDGSNEDYKIKEKDGVFFFNFRADRARMLSKRIIEKASQSNICFVTLTHYEDDFHCDVAFPQVKLETTLATELSKAGLSQVHIAETEKYAHVTYFFNGGQEVCHDGECHVLVDSRKDIPTHDHAPKMRAQEITNKAIEQLENGTQFILMNFANPDMVGHTANVPAIVEAVEEVDKELGRIEKEIEKVGGIAIITADHGNAELNIDPETGIKHTAHTLNPVPVIITNTDRKVHDGGLADLAPTVLDIFGLPKPDSMSGNSLFD